MSIVDGLHTITSDEIDDSVDDSSDNSAGDETIDDTEDNDEKHSGIGDDTVNGCVGDDSLNGGDGNDTLAGGLGKDTLTGGLGSDTFKFSSVVEAGAGIKSDVISDFVSGVDKIDLSAIDARTGLTANDVFTFLTDAPMAANANGAIWFKDGVLYGSTDKDAAAEFEIQLPGVTILSPKDIVL